jgi:hypothetical protein
MMLVVNKTTSNFEVVKSKFSNDEVEEDYSTMKTLGLSKSILHTDIWRFFSLIIVCATVPNLMLCM